MPAHTFRATALQKHTISIAPMMDRTNKHYRYLMRLITKKTTLYTEMIPADTIFFGNNQKFLSYGQQEHPVVLQVGGSDPKYLKDAAKKAEDYGYDEINLNVGCPSDRVQAGTFGACLMKTPELVAKLCEAMLESTSIPVTVKHRIGVDDLDQYDHMKSFVETVAKVGVKRFNVHARKALLSGLSPKENRMIPPLRYDLVYQLKDELPNLTIEINGGILTLEQASEQLTKVDGVMIGRAAWDNPWIFSTVDQQFYNEPTVNISRAGVIKAYQEYIELQLKDGHPMTILLQPVFNLFNGLPGAKHWRRYITENGYQKKVGPQVLEQALQLITNHFDLPTETTQDQF